MTNKGLLNDCFLHDKDRLRHDEALDLLKSRLSAIVDTETISLGMATGRILSEPVKVRRPIPFSDNSAVDGYAFNSADLAFMDGVLPITQRLAAGAASMQPLQKNTAARIFTGASVPAGADTIAMQEDCETTTLDGQPAVIIPQGLKSGANLRRAGEDQQPGDAVANSGERLTPQILAAIASTGCAEVVVFKKLRIALLSTGDEILRPGTPQSPGQIYDANHFMLTSLLASYPVELTDAGVVKDDHAALSSVVSSLARNHDVVITSGGASRGEEDHILAVLDELGKRHLWQLAVKPGRPMMFGQIATGEHQTLFFGLPGNPVAAMVCFLLYTRPALTCLAGGLWPEPTRFPLPAQFEIASKKPDRREFLRGSIIRTKGCAGGVDKFARDGSGLISSLRLSDGLIEIPEETTSLTKGELVNFIPWSELGVS